VGDRRSAVARPWPIGAAVERVGQRADLLLVFTVLIEKTRGGEHAGEEETGIDRGHFALAGAPSGGHIEKVIVEAVVPGRIGRSSLRTGPEEPQHRKRALDCVGAGHPAARDADRINRQREAHGRDTGGRTWLRFVSHQPVRRVGLVQEILEGVML